MDASKFNYRFVACCFLTMIILSGCPVIGIFLAGMDVKRFIEFPPITGYVSHAPKSPVLFFTGLVLAAGLTVPVAFRLIKRIRHSAIPEPSGSFPPWGFLGLLLLLVFWAVSWGLTGHFKGIRMWAFTPLWIGFILFLNALDVWWTGSCLLLRRPVSFLGLFPLSSIFWWYFEFLNRFVQNWYYVGVSQVGAATYALRASLAFSTVLPAVMSVNELLKPARIIEEAFDFTGAGMARPLKVAAFAMLLLTSAALILLCKYPDYLFPFVWISPLCVICAVRALLGLPNLMTLWAMGKFGPLSRLSASGLICGFFWEMWNYLSYPKWVYSIPFVSQCKVFEMPILGYFGYLPFGLECGAVSALIIPLWEICGVNGGDSAGKM